MKIAPNRTRRKSARLVAYAVFQINILLPSKPGTIAIYCHLNPEPVAIFLNLLTISSNFSNK